MTFRATIAVLGNLISFMTFQGTEILINFNTLYDVSGHDSHIRKFNALYDVSGQRDLIKISIPFMTVWATIAILGNLISFMTFQSTEILLRLKILYDISGHHSCVKNFNILYVKNQQSGFYCNYHTPIIIERSTEIFKPFMWRITSQASIVTIIPLS